MCATLGYERNEEKDHDLRLKTLASPQPDLGASARRLRASARRHHRKFGRAMSERLLLKSERSHRARSLAQVRAEMHEFNANFKWR